MPTMRYTLRYSLFCGLAALLLAGSGSAADSYRDRELVRLQSASDRDSLITAVLLTLPANLADPATPPGAAVDAPLQRLRAAYPDDTLALYVAAAVCQAQPQCSDDSAHRQLVAAAPDNAVHWLLLPARAEPDAATLQRAAAAAQAQPRLGELLQLLQRTLSSADAAARADVLDAAPQPVFASLLRACQHSEGKVRADCLSVGRKLLADEQGSILSRMIGSVQVRRLSPQADEVAAAREFRRQYVWLTGQVNVEDENLRTALRHDLVTQGEWQALKNAVTAAGKALVPATDWQPANPQTLLLPEQRSAAPR